MQNPVAAENQRHDKITEFPERIRRPGCHRPDIIEYLELTEDKVIHQKQHRDQDEYRSPAQSVHSFLFGKGRQNPEKAPAEN